MSIRVRTLLPFSLLALVIGCDTEDSVSMTQDAGGTTDVPEATTKAAVETYARIVHASYSDSLAAATDLDTEITAFVTTPSEQGLEDARDAWLASREPYLQTEVYRFYEGPIDNEEDGPEGLMNAWPLDEAYIDYVEGDDDSGIVNDPSITIDADALVALNEQAGETSIATGYHAIEFLLWGQDMDPDGPGDRPYTDYVDGEGGTAENADRRAEYLTTVSSLLLLHLDELVAAWAPDATPANYRSEFESVAPKEALRRILTGMIVLSGFETGGERLQTALDSGLQEDEHSCFSDNTHRDMVQDVQGVWNVWHGKYGTDVVGTGVRDVVAEVNDTLAAQLDAEIDASLTAAKALKIPFDKEIASGNSEGNERVQTLIEALRKQEGSLQEVFQLFGLTIPDPE